MKLCLWNNWNGPLTVTLKLGTHMSNQALILRQLMISTELEVVDLSHGCMLLLCRRKAKNADWPQLGICHMITGCQIQDLKFVVILVTKLIDAWCINALREYLNNFPINNWFIRQHVFIEIWSMWEVWRAWKMRKSCSRCSQEQL